MEAASDLIAENRWSLPGAGTGRKGAYIALVSQRLSGLELSRGQRDVPPRRVLPHVLVDFFLLV